MTTRWVIGLASGSSADGVDAALLETEGVGLEMRVRLHALGQPYGKELRDLHSRRAIGPGAPATLATSPCCIACWARRLPRPRARLPIAPASVCMRRPVHRPSRTHRLARSRWPLLSRDARPGHGRRGGRSRHRRDRGQRLPRLAMSWPADRVCRSRRPRRLSPLPPCQRKPRSAPSRRTVACRLPPGQLSHPRNHWL